MNRPDTVVLGVDPGIATTGWGVVACRRAQLTLQSFGAIETAARTRLPDRLFLLKRELAAILTAHRPDVVAIEQLFFTKFATSIAATAQARGVVLLAAAECGLPVIEYNPRAVKVAMTGFGGATKIQMQTMLQQYFRLAELPRPDDAADAVAIALCHLQTNPALAGRGETAGDAANAGLPGAISLPVPRPAV